MDGRKEELGAALAENMQKWTTISENGCGEPFCEDGKVMNTIRGRIIALKKRCESELQKGGYPPEYNEETPQEVKNTYMVNPSQIKRRAKKVLRSYEENEDYLWLKKKAEGYTDDQLRAAGLEYILHYPEALRFFIEKNLYVDMRRHVLNPERYIASFKKGRERAEALPAPGAGRRKQGMKLVSPQKEPLPEPDRPYLSVRFNNEAPGQDKAQEKEKDAVPQKKAVSPAGKKRTAAGTEKKQPVKTEKDAVQNKKEKRRAGRQSLPEGQMSMFDMGFAAV